MTAKDLKDMELPRVFTPTTLSEIHNALLKMVSRCKSCANDIRFEDVLTALREAYLKAEKVKPRVTWKQIEVLRNLVWHEKEKASDEGRWLVDARKACELIEEWYSNGCDCCHDYVVTIKSDDLDIAYIRECKLCNRIQYAKAKGKTAWFDSLAELHSAKETA